MSSVFRRSLVALVWLAACGSDGPEPREPLDRGDGAVSPPPPEMLDADRDGFSPEQGDCDDSDPLIGPGAIDIVGNGIDEDCDGEDAQQEVTCDEALREASDDASDAARALGLCSFRKVLNDRRWGVRSARFVRMNGDAGLGSPLQVGLSPRFGDIEPRQGSRLLVMSTGVARDALHEDFTPACDVFDSEPIAPGEWSGGSTPPKFFPVDSSRCPEGTSSKGAPAYNDIELELMLRVPQNAQSLSFESMFFTYEYPDYVCSRFNDFFIVQMGEGTRPGSAKDNILYDSSDGLVGVNTALLSVCRRSERSAIEQPCSEGPALLKNTGFDREESTCGVHVELPDLGGASTGWLKTHVPVVGGRQVVLRFRLWDSGDPNLDSTVLLDNFRFSTEAFSEPVTSPTHGGN